MRPLAFGMVAMMVACSAFIAPVTWAADHVMVEPNDLKWEDVPSMPPGAKVAVIEGPMNEAVPFTIRLKFPANYKIPPHWHPAIEHVPCCLAASTWASATSWIRPKPRRYRRAVS